MGKLILITIAALMTACGPLKSPYTGKELSCDGSSAGTYTEEPGGSNETLILNVNCTGRKVNCGQDITWSYEGYTSWITINNLNFGNHAGCHPSGQHQCYFMPYSESGVRMLELKCQGEGEKIYRRTSAPAFNP